MRLSFLTKYLLRRAALYVVVTTVMVIFMFPFWWMVASSLKPDPELFTFPPKLFPTTPVVRHYEDLLMLWPFFDWSLNSIKVALTVAFSTICFATFGGYSVSRLRFRGKEATRILILFSYLFPGILLVVPLFTLISKLRLHDTHYALMLTYHVYTVPFSIYFLAAFFDGVPEELEEQAMVDGATRLGAFLRVILPLAAPGITACAIYAFIVAYSEFLFAFVFLSTDEVFTLPAGLALLAVRSDIPWGQLMAASTLVSIPAILLFLLIQKYFIAGLTAGAIKG